MINEELFKHKYQDKYFKVVKENLYFQDELESNYINFEEKRNIPDLLGKTVKVAERQFFNVYKIIKEICEVLDIEEVVAYVYEDFFYGVQSKGISKPWLEISAKTIADFTDEELRFLIGKELYNIKFKNTYYASLIKYAFNNLGSLNLNITEDALKLTVYKWNRVMNFSSDNFGYCICNNLKSATKAILLSILNNKKLAEGVSIAEYLKQGDEISKLDDDVYNNTKVDEMVPYGPYRIKNIISYASSVRAVQAKKRIFGL